MARVFLDSGVFMEGISAEWGAAKAVLILGCYHVLDVETSEVVLAELMGALRRKGISTNADSDFARLMRLIGPVIHPRPSEEEILAGLQKYLPLMRHRADVAVLVAAIKVSPDWLVSSNTRHFTATVARASGLRVVSPAQLMRHLSIRDVS